LLFHTAATHPSSPRRRHCPTVTQNPRAPLAAAAQIHSTAQHLVSHRMCAGSTALLADSESRGRPRCSASSIRSASTRSPLLTRLVILPAIRAASGQWMMRENFEHAPATAHRTAPPSHQPTSQQQPASHLWRRRGRWQGQRNASRQPPCGSTLFFRSHTCGAGSGGAAGTVQVVHWVEREVKVDDVINTAGDVQTPATGGKKTN